MNVTIKPNYATWIRSRKVVLFFILTILSLLGAILTSSSILFLIFLAPMGIFGYITIILLLTMYQFSARGGDFQNQIHNLLIAQLPVEGSILDIGCGSGHLAIACAKGSPGRKVYGLDYWGKNWEYSKSQCEKNALAEGASNQITFQQGSASHLPFDNESMDAVVSCLTFHEVRDITERSICIEEALRVLKKGGSFVFFDLFRNRAYFPNLNSICERVSNVGGFIKDNRPIVDFLRLPFPLNNGKVLGYGQLIIGLKGKT